MRIGEPCLLAGDHDVGVGDVVEPTTRAHAVDGDDDGHLEPATGQERQLVVDVVAERRPFAVETAHVGTGAEALARAGEHDATDGTVLAHLGPEVAQLDPHGIVERVPLLGPIEGEGQHVLGAFDEVGVGHRRARYFSPGHSSRGGGTWTWVVSGVRPRGGLDGAHGSLRLRR